LVDAVRARLGDNVLHTGMLFQSMSQDSRGVTARFLNRYSGEVEEVRGDVLIGADGIHSAVRRHFHPNNDTLRFSGRMLWRATTEAPSYLDGRTMFMAGHQDQKF